MVFISLHLIRIAQTAWQIAHQAKLVFQLTWQAKGYINHAPGGGGMGGPQEQSLVDLTARSFWAGHPNIFPGISDNSI